MRILAEKVVIKTTKFHADVEIHHRDKVVIVEYIGTRGRDREY